MIDTLCMGGGGIKGIAFLGTLKYLEDQSYCNLKNINKFVGTSAGSILAFFLSIGYTVPELIDFVSKFNFEKFGLDINCNTFLTKFGIDTGQKIMTAVKTFLSEKFELDDISFKDLYEKTNVELSILTTNYTLSKNEIFNYKNTPDVSVILAIRMSMSVPFIFTPVEFNNYLYVDGGLTCNFGLFHCKKETTLGLAIQCISSENNIGSFPEYIVNLCNILIDSNTMNSIRYLENNDLKYNYILINCKQKQSMEFTVNKEKINDLLEDGKESAKKYYSNFIIKDIVNNLVEKVSQ
jgi:hypothetical protein